MEGLLPFSPCKPDPRGDGSHGASERHPGRIELAESQSAQLKAANEHLKKQLADNSRSAEDGLKEKAEELHIAQQQLQKR